MPKLPVSLTPLLLFIVSCGASQSPPTASSPTRRAGIVERLGVVLADEFGLQGVTPQGLELLSVGHIVNDKMRSQSTVPDLCPQPTAKNDDFIRRGPIASFSFDEKESFTFSASLGLQASQASEWLPNLKLYVRDGDTVSMTLSLNDPELLTLKDARFSRYLDQVAGSCHALAERLPVTYVRELILAQVEFSFRRRGETDAGISLGWTVGAPGAAMSVSGGVAEVDDEEEDEDSGDDDEESADGEDDDDDAEPESAPVGTRDAVLGLSADGRWRIERGGRIVSNERLVVGVALSEFSGR